MVVHLTPEQAVQVRSVLDEAITDSVVHEFFGHNTLEVNTESFDGNRLLFINDISGPVATALILKL